MDSTNIVFIILFSLIYHVKCVKPKSDISYSKYMKLCIEDIYKDIDWSTSKNRVKNLKKKLSEHLLYNKNITMMTTEFSIQYFTHFMDKIRTKLDLQHPLLHCMGMAGGSNTLEQREAFFKNCHEEMRNVYLLIEVLQTETDKKIYLLSDNVTEIAKDAFARLTTSYIEQLPGTNQARIYYNKLQQGIYFLEDELYSPYDFCRLNYYLEIKQEISGSHEEENDHNDPSSSLPKLISNQAANTSS